MDTRMKKEEPDATQLSESIHAVLDDGKAEDIRVLDVRELTDVTDCMVVATGNSSRHVGALADRVLEAMREQGLRPLGVEGSDDSEWILIDFGDIVCHLMLPKTREFYDLEGLWDPGLGELLKNRRDGNPTHTP